MTSPCSPPTSLSPPLGGEAGLTSDLCMSAALTDGWTDELVGPAGLLYLSPSTWTHWKDGGRESPMPPVLSMGGGATLVGVAIDTRSDPPKSD